MTQRDGMGREEGGGFRMGNTCIPVADSCWCMAKPIQYCKVKNNNNKKIKDIFYRYFFFFLILFIYLAALGLSCGMWDLAPWPGIEPGPPAVGAQRLSHWTTREVPTATFSNVTVHSIYFTGFPDLKFIIAFCLLKANVLNSKILPFTIESIVSFNLH